MGTEQNVALVEEIWRTMSAQDLEIYADALHESAVQEWPQSGERVVGRDNIIAINRSYPGFPLCHVVRTIGAGDLVVSEVTLDYDGTVYHGVSVFEFRDGKIVHERDYFAEPFDPPGWRAQWVERM